MDADTELFLQVREGNDQAFKQLYQKHYRKTLNLIFRFVHNEQDAEDIAQEVFLRAYYGARSFSPRAKFSTWLYRITVNRCFSHHKKAKRHKEKHPSDSDFLGDPKLAHPADIQEYPSSEPSPNGHIVRKELHQEIRSALDRLPAEQRMAFVLLEYAGLSYQEIATVTSASPKAVERRIYHARQKLRGLLKPYLAT